MSNLSNRIINITGNNIPEQANDYSGLLLKEKIEKSDVFIFSSSQNTNPMYKYSSNVIEYKLLSADVISKIKSNNVENIEKIWFFDKLSSGLYIDSNIISENLENIGKDKASNIGINIDYFENQIKEKVFELSSKIYDENSLERKIPSTPGQIITSSTLSTLTAVQNIYGSDTEWEQISERSIIGVGSVDEYSNNNKKWGDILPDQSEKISAANEKGGNSEIRLNNSQIPQHEHNFKANRQEVEFDFRVSFINERKFSDYVSELSGDRHWGIFGRKTKFPGTGVQAIKWIMSDSGWTDQWENNPGSTMFCYATSDTTSSSTSHKCWKSGTIGSLTSSWNIFVNLSTKDIIGNNKNMRPDIFDHSTGQNITSSNGKKYPNSNNSKNNTKPHNNLPPFITKFMWLRTK